MYRIINYSTEETKWLKAAKLTPDRYLVISPYKGEDDLSYVLQVFDHGKGEYREAKHFPSLALAVEAYRTYLKNRLIELVNNLSHEPEDDLDGVWRLWVNEDFEYTLTQGEAAHTGFYLLGILAELFQQREEKQKKWAILLKDIDGVFLNSPSSGE